MFVNVGLSRRQILRTAIAAAVGIALPVSRVAAATWDRYDASIVIDGLCALRAFNATPGTPLTDSEMKDARDSGLTCVHMTVDPGSSATTDLAFVETVMTIGRLERRIERNPETFARIRSVNDIVAAKKSRRCGLLYGVQDPLAFEQDLTRLEELYHLGLRVVQPTYNRRNLWGDGCLEPANAGLSITGREAVERMNSLGILIDLSHCGRQTAADAIRFSKAPVAFTHTGCDALAKHPRNRTDAELRSVAEKGGVIGIYFMPYLTAGKQPTAAAIIRHIDHAVQVAGEEHVSLGTDGGIPTEIVDQAYREIFAADNRARLDAGIAAPDETDDGFNFASDLNTPRKFETLAGMLQQRGYSEGRIEKILGRNLLRVFGQAWKN